MVTVMQTICHSEVEGSRENQLKEIMILGDCILRSCMYHVNTFKTFL